MKGDIQLEQTLQALRHRSNLERQVSITVRKERLKALKKTLLSHRTEIGQAIKKDINKPPIETDLSELYPVLTEINHALKHVTRWARPKRVPTPISLWGTQSRIHYEPKGVCLIIAPWNYPLNLCIGPLVSCLAAGNTAIIKPSELAPNTSAIIKKIVSESIEDSLVQVLEGGPDLSKKLTTLPFDHIFVTGSPAVGREVMREAAAHLTSVTLELGGKSPAIIDSSARLADAARRIAFGKFLNNGQTCIAPDYVLVEQSVKKEFIQQLILQTKALFGEQNAITETSPHYGRIINERHFNRLKSLVDDAIAQGAKIEWSEGEFNPTTKFIPPVILSNVSDQARISEEEIFGPILPIYTVTREDEFVQKVLSLPKPLALYIFSQRPSFYKRLTSKLSSGATCINECILHFLHPHLPFGGVNYSGIGKSHGFYGFQSFSNEKPVLRQKNGWSFSYLIHPPYTKQVKKITNKLLKWT